MTTENSRADALTNYPREVEECREALRGEGFVPVLPELQDRHATVSDPIIPAELHHDTAKLVRRFARALANKLLAAQRKYGYSDNWMRDDWADECRAELMRHIQKGDPRDVAAYCAFLWHHNESTSSEQAATTLTDDQRADLRKLEAAATPGPWRYQENSDAYTHIVRSDANPGMIIAYGPQGTSGQVEADIRFIAAIRNAAPAILAASPANQPAAAPIDPRANRGRSVGDWLWCELMDYCKERGMPPASNGRLFNLVDCARAAWDGAQSATSAPPSPADERAAWFSVAMNAAASLEDAANWLTDPDSKRLTEGAAAFARKRANELWQARAASTSETGAEGARPRNRSAEWGGYLATNVERLIEAVNALHELEMREDDGEEVSEDDLQHARETLSEYMGAVRSSIYDFHRRTKQDSDEAACRSPAMAVEKLTNLPSYLPSHALRGLYKPADEYFIDGKPCTPEEYISWQAGIIEAVTKAKLPDPKYYGGSAEEGDQHDVKCAYADGWNDCRASILAAPQPAQADARVGLTGEQIAHVAAAHTNSVVEFDRLLKFARALLQGANQS